MISRLSRVCATACLAVLLAPSLGIGAVVPAAEGTIRFVCSDSDGSKHPKREVVEQLVQFDPPTGTAATAFVLDYDSTQEGEPRAGLVQVTIELVRNGETRKLESFKMRTDPVSGRANRVVVVPEVLEASDLVRWKFKFKKFDALRQDKCFVLLATSTALTEEDLR